MQLPANSCDPSKVLCMIPVAPNYFPISFNVHLVLCIFFVLKGSTPIDLAEPDMGRMLEELKKRQNDKPKINAVSLEPLNDLCLVGLSNALLIHPL